MDAADGAAGLVEMVNGGRAKSAAPPLTRSRSTAGVLEERLAGKKYETYAPMVAMLRDVFDDAEKAFDLKKVIDFAAWISIYGSDEAVRNYQRFMQAAYHDAPGGVSLRLYAEFVLTARRDIGTQETELTAEHILGIRLNDLYDKKSTYDIATMPIDELCAELGWEAPWRRVRREMADDDPDQAVTIGSLSGTPT